MVIPWAIALTSAMLAYIYAAFVFLGFPLNRFGAESDLFSSGASTILFSTGAEIALASTGGKRPFARATSSGISVPIPTANLIAS